MELALRRLVAGGLRLQLGLEARLLGLQLAGKTCGLHLHLTGESGGLRLQLLGRESSLLWLLEALLATVAT